MKCKELNNNNMYLHCYARSLNLVLVDDCTLDKGNRLIFDFFGIVQYIYTFIEGSCSRNVIFEKNSNKIGATLRTLKSLSTTRWTCHAKAVSMIKVKYTLILRALAEIIETTNQSNAKVKGIGLLHQVKSFNFIFGLTMMHPILQLIVKVSTFLQSPDINLINATSSTQFLRGSFINLRNVIKLENVYKEAKDLCMEQEIDIPMVKNRKVSSRCDDSAKTQYYYETKEELRSTCSY